MRPTDGLWLGFLYIWYWWKSFDLVERIINHDAHSHILYLTKIVQARTNYSLVTSYRIKSVYKSLDQTQKMHFWKEPEMRLELQLALFPTVHFRHQNKYRTSSFFTSKSDFLFLAYKRSKTYQLPILHNLNRKLSQFVCWTLRSAHL